MQCKHDFLPLHAACAKAPLEVVGTLLSDGPLDGVQSENCASPSSVTCLVPCPTWSGHTPCWLPARRCACKARAVFHPFM